MGLVGNLEDLGLGDILQIISLSRKSGVLSLHHHRERGKIIFRDGVVVNACSNYIQENLAEYLARKNVIQKTTAQEAFKIFHQSGKREQLKSIFINRFKIPPEKIEKEIVSHVEEIVYHFFTWDGGTFSFELKEVEDEIGNLSDIDKDFILEKGISPQFLALEGAKIQDEKRREKEEQRKRMMEEMETESVEEQICPSPGEDLLDLREQFRDDLEDIELSGLANREVQKVRTSPGLSILKGMLMELHGSLSIQDIPLLVLRFASEIFNRGVIFIIKKGYFTGHGQFGIELANSNPDQVIRDMRIPVNEKSVLKEAVEKKGVVKKKPELTKWNTYFFEQIGGQVPEEVFVAPVIVDDRTASVLYGDNIPYKRSIGDTESLEIFISQAAMVMERKILEKRLKELTGETKN